MSNDGKAKEMEYEEKGYALSGKIMLIAIVVLFIVIIIMLCLHVYVRYYLLRPRRRQHLRRNGHSQGRRPQLIFYVDPAAPAALTLASRGLDASVIASLPVFTFSPETHREPVECAVCLSEFEDGETGRVLPKCNHSFHIDCIDMWFQSHSTCPLCRAPVESPPAGETRSEFVVTVREPEPGSSSGLCPECQHDGEEMNRTGQAVSSSSSSIGKPSSLVGVTVEVPGRSESFGDESGCDSPSTQSSSFRSPMSRMLSFKRILSRERKASFSLSSGCGAGCSSMAELEAERGGRPLTQ